MHTVNVKYLPEALVVVLSVIWRTPLSLIVWIATIGLWITTTPVAEAAARPNVVIILADDQGWGDLSVNGNTNLSTPNIDSLARDGAIFDRFFVCPVCSPTRAEFLTGRYHPRGGVYSTSTGGERLNLGERTIAEAFKAAGYATGAFGKWHNGTQYPYHPNARGFDEYYGFCSGHWGSYFNPDLEHNGHLVKGKGFITDDLANHAMEFIEKNRNKPFLCYVPFNTPHSPLQVPGEFYAKFQGAPVPLRYAGAEREEIESTRAILAMCENIDWNVGRILKKLEDLKLADDTVVIYFSDNGPNTWRWNGGMKGRKGSTDEGGIRSPFLVRWPGHIKPGTRIAEIAGAVDLLPTLPDVCGVPRVGDRPLDGVSLKPLQYRLDNGGKLYDLTVDPGQAHDVSTEHAEVQQRLASAMAKWKKELLPGLGDDGRPFPVGYSEFPITQLPARDGVPRGGIRRSASAPNCSYFTEWKRPGDTMIWDIEVATSGKYEALIYYSCPKEDVGSTIELSFNGSRIEGRVSEAHDPPLMGAENDRVPRRGESYVKDWKPLRLGLVDLKQGRGPLTLKATNIPGKQVMDVREILLTLVK
jgi:arylsulfatase A-like enzyme